MCLIGLVPTRKAWGWWVATRWRFGANTNAYILSRAGGQTQAKIKYKTSISFSALFIHYLFLTVYPLLYLHFHKPNVHVLPTQMRLRVTRNAPVQAQVTRPRFLT